MTQHSPIIFHASAIEGAGRGREYGIPTVNINLASVPAELEEGIYACFVNIENDEKKYLGAMHYGPRPVFKDSRACEIHLIDAVLSTLPAEVTVTVIEHLRAIRNFSSVEELKEQILDDIGICRAILGKEC